MQNQSLEQQIIQQARGLPESAQRKVLHYIELIRGHSIVTQSERKPSKSQVSWRETPMYGLWQDREDMTDPIAYVRQMRRPRF